MSNDARNSALNALEAFRQGEVDPVGLAEALEALLDAGRGDTDAQLHMAKDWLFVARCTCGESFSDTSPEAARYMLAAHVDKGTR